MQKHLKFILSIVLFSSLITLMGCIDDSDTTPPVITILGENPVSIEQGATYTDAGATATDDEDGLVPVLNSGSVDTGTPGTYTITYRAYDTSGNSATAYRTVYVLKTVADTTPPVITLNGDAQITIAQGTAYTDAGATAVDDVDGSVSVTASGEVDTSVPGVYTITYTAQDSAGNTATATRTITVTTVTNDTTPPVITINGEAQVTIAQGAAYTDAGATAVDDVDGNVSVVTSGEVNTAVPGVYTITYTAQDKAGNSASATRTVRVVAGDTTPPVITINGEAQVTIAQGTAYTDAGATAVDDVDGNVSVAASGEVNTAVPGVYTITYTAQDKAGNTATATRTVTVTPVVNDTTPPVITLNGESQMTIAQGATFSDPGATAVDDVDGAVSVRASGEVNTEIPDVYTILYTAQDKAGNTATATRTVQVTAGDAKAPLILINGWSKMNIALNASYTDAGATAEDDEDGMVTVTASGSVDTGRVGTYTITYTASDTSGNVATAERRVTVGDRDEYVIDGHYIVGPVMVTMGDGTESSLRLHVQRHRKNGNAWTNEPLVLPDGRTPPDIFAESKQVWQSFYQDMVNRGMPPSELRQMLAGITGSHPSAGVWVQTGLGACGYAGAPRQITCGPDARWGVISHESMHGWSWSVAEDPPNVVDSILLQDLFTQWANWVYHTRLTNPELLQGRNSAGYWVLDYLNYGLQNDAEWLANVFAGWLYGPYKVKGQNWQAIKKSYPEYEQLFDCLWKEGGELQECHRKAFGVNEIKHPQYHPTEGVPAVAGFTEEDSVAIWKVCTDAPDKGAYADRFNRIVKSVAPDLPGSPADHYSLGYGDCNHDGTTDWICTYTGPGPIGVGNGRYLWNRANRDGAYAFIVSGIKSEPYAEYMPDPYLTLPSMGGGALAQPWYREWQGEYGSCNGASIFDYRTQEWINEYLKDLN